MVLTRGGAGSRATQPKAKPAGKPKKKRPNQPPSPPIQIEDEEEEFYQDQFGNLTRERPPTPPPLVFPPRDPARATTSGHLARLTAAAARPAVVRSSAAATRPAATPPLNAPKQLARPAVDKARTSPAALLPSPDQPRQTTTEYQQSRPAAATSISGQQTHSNSMDLDVGEDETNPYHDETTDAPPFGEDSASSGDETTSDPTFKAAQPDAQAEYDQDSDEFALASRRKGKKPVNKQKEISSSKKRKLPSPRSDSEEEEELLDLEHTRLKRNRKMPSKPKPVVAARHQTGHVRISSRSRGKKIPVQVPPTIDNLNGWLSFDEPSTIDKLHEKLKCEVTPCAEMDLCMLNNLEVFDSVTEYVDNIGWKKLFFPKYACFLELNLEFYSSFWLVRSKKISKGVNEVNFRLVDHYFHISMDEFNVRLGFVNAVELNATWYKNSLIDYPDDFDTTDAYRQLTQDPTATFDDSHAKAHSIVDLSLRILHRCLAISLSGKRKVSGIISKMELFILWSMVNKRKLNLGHWISQQVRSSRSLMPLGSLITALAVEHRNLDLTDTPLHKSCDLKLIDMIALDKMGYFHLEGNVLCSNTGFTPVQDHVFAKKHGGRFIFAHQKDTVDAAGTSRPPVDTAPDQTSEPQPEHTTRAETELSTEAELSLLRQMVIRQEETSRLMLKKLDEIQSEQNNFAALYSSLLIRLQNQHQTPPHP